MEPTTRIVFEVDEEATQDLHRMILAGDIPGIQLMVNAFAPLDFVGGFDREIPYQDPQGNIIKRKTPICGLNGFYATRLWAMGKPLHQKWDWKDDRIWRGRYEQRPEAQDA